MDYEHTAVEAGVVVEIDAAQKRRLRLLRRAYRAQSVEIRNGGWELEITYMDGSKVVVNPKLVKLKADGLK